jgi:hypothetical protein
MSGGEWTTQRERRQTREDAREAKRRLVIAWQDALWLAQNHPCGDSVLAWLSENRAEASKIGASRWNLETLPALVNRQAQLRKAAKFAEVLRRASVSSKTLTVQDVLGDSPQIPQNQLGETGNGAAPALQRPRRRDAGKARPSRKTTTKP